MRYRVIENKSEESQREIPHRTSKARARTQEIYFIFQVIAQWKLDVPNFSFDT